MHIIDPELFQIFNPKKSLSAMRHIIDFLDHIQRGMNPEADPHMWPYCMKTDMTVEELREKLEKMGFCLDYPFQHYKDQSLSGHLFYKDGHQLHIRAFPLKRSGFGLKAHYEWCAETNPVKHLACRDISYPNGCRKFKKLWTTKDAKVT